MGPAAKQGIMFRLVRFFVLTSAATAVAIAIALYVYRQGEVQRLVAFAEQQNVELARSFANTIWPGLSPLVNSMSGPQANDQTGGEQSQAIARIVTKATVGLPVLKVKIYNLEGLTVYSSDAAEIGEYKTDNTGFFSAARAGQPASELIFRDTISSFEKTVQKRDLVESYLPIQQGDGPVEGVFELYSDVTPLMTGLRQSTRNLLIGFLPIFAVLYGALFLGVRRAEQTIKQQYADITEKNAALKEAHDLLEVRVEERTRKLAEEIAERKRMQDEVQRHRNELAHVGRVSMIGEMASSLAHELNQPLSVISGCAQICLNELKGGAGSPKKLLDAMEQTAEQAERATKIIRRVRDFIHKEEPRKRRIDVNEAIRNIEALLRSDAREHDVDVELELAGTALPVSADAIQLQQVVLNLVHNGIEAMSDAEADSRHLSIRTSRNNNGMVEVAVRDQGHGIPADNLARLFDPFYTTKPHGLGMGLSISRSIAEVHGGRLQVTSDRKNGTVFRFALPALEGDGSDDK
jgi:signal transduction histidine kinase